MLNLANEPDNECYNGKISRINAIAYRITHPGITANRYLDKKVRNYTIYSHG
jgi:hypothetical protein